MVRVLASMLGVALSFALLVHALDLGRIHGGSLHSAFGTFIGVLVVGYPVLFLCCRRGWWRADFLAVLGAGGGAATSLAFGGGSYGFGFLLFVFVLVGAVLGLLFWLTAIWRNDDLVCPKSFCLPCGAAYKVARRMLHRRDVL